METVGRSGRHRLHWLSLNGDSPVGPQNRTRNDPIRVNSCPFVVFYCMDTAKQTCAGTGDGAETEFLSPQARRRASLPANRPTRRLPPGGKLRRVSAAKSDAPDSVPRAMPAPPQ